MQQLLAWVRRVVSIAIVPILVVALTDFIVDQANPFGIGTAIEAAVARLIQREAVALGISGGASPGQKVVTVVLINRDFIQKFTHSDEATWPLPVSSLMRYVIRPVLNEKPAAVFIDLAFPKAPREITPGVNRAGEQGEQNAADYLADRLVEIDQDSTLPPVFLADVVVPTRDDDALKGSCDVSYVAEDKLVERSVMSRELRAKVFGSSQGATRISLVDSGVLNAKGGYQLAPIATGPSGSCGLQLEKGLNYIPSPAIALLRAYCPPTLQGGYRRRELCGRKPVQPLAASIMLGKERSPLGVRLYGLKKPAARNVMELRWRTNLTPETRQAFEGVAGTDACLAQFRYRTFEPLIIYAATLFKPLEEAFSTELERPCMAIDTITPADIHAEFKEGEGLAGRSFGGVFIRDRIVLIGVDLTQAGDTYESPTSGVIPGVYVHATAIENLLTRGDTYSPAEPEPQIIALLYLVSAIAVFILSWLWRKFLAIGQRRWPPIGELVLAPAAYLVVALLVSICLLFLFDVILPNVGMVLPLTKIALPILAVHLVLFADWGERLRDCILRIALRRTSFDLETKRR